MPDVKGTSRAQTLFLRNLRAHPFGPPRDEWPSPLLLRKWLKKRSFKSALDSIRRSLRYQADFHLLYAAARAARHLHLLDLEEFNPSIKLLIDLLRLAHLRQRFTRDKEPIKEILTPPSIFHRLSPNLPLGDALKFIDLTQPSEADEDGSSAEAA